MVDVTIPDEATFITFDASSVGPHAFNWTYFAKADLRISIDGVELAQSAFTHTPGVTQDGGYRGGSITLNVAVSGGEGKLWRVVQTVRTDNYSAGPLSPQSISRDLTKIVGMAQDARRDLGRAPKVPVGVNVDSGELGEPSDNYVLGWFGGAWAWMANFGAVAVSSLMQSVLAASSAHAVAKLLGGTYNVADLATFKALASPGSGVTYNLLTRVAESDGGGGSFTWKSGDRSAYLIYSTRAVQSVNTGTDIATTTAAHEYEDGDAVIVSAADAGLSAETIYYVNRPSTTTCSFHTTIDDAIAGTNKVNLTALAGSLSLEKLVDPGQGIYIVPNGARLSGRDGCYERQRAQGEPFQMSWWGVRGFGGGTSAENIKAAFHAELCVGALFPDLWIRPLRWAPTLIWPDGDVVWTPTATQQYVYAVNWKEGNGTRLIGNVGAICVLRFGRVDYLNTANVGYRPRHITGMAMSFSGCTRPFESYLHNLQWDRPLLVGGSVSAGDVYGAYENGWIRDPIIYGTTGGGLRWLNSCAGQYLDGGITMFAAGIGMLNNVEAPKITNHCIIYNTVGFKSIDAGAVYPASLIRLTRVWFEGDTSLAVDIDNSGFEVECVSLLDCNIYGNPSNIGSSGIVRVGKSGETREITGIFIRGNLFAGPATVDALQFPCAAAVYPQIPHDLRVSNSFRANVAIDFPARPEIEVYPEGYSRAPVSVTASGGGFSLGDGQHYQLIQRVGNQVTVVGALILGATTNVGTGNFSIDIPYRARNYPAHWIGGASYLDSGTVLSYAAASLVLGGNNFLQMHAAADGATYGAAIPIAVPAVNDYFRYTITYECEQE